MRPAPLRMNGEYWLRQATTSFVKNWNLQSVPNTLLNYADLHIFNINPSELKFELSKSDIIIF